MNLEMENKLGASCIYIDGNIKSISDNNEIRQAIETAYEKSSTEPINIYIKDSFIVTSTVIGHLIKFIKKDNMQITLYVSNHELYEMLDNMDLIDMLNVKKDFK